MTLLCLTPSLNNLRIIPMLMMVMIVIVLTRWNSIPTRHHAPLNLLKTTSANIFIMMNSHKSNDEETLQISNILTPSAPQPRNGKKISFFMSCIQEPANCPCILCPHRANSLSALITQVSKDNKSGMNIFIITRTFQRVGSIVLSGNGQLYRIKRNAHWDEKMNEVFMSD